MKYIGITNTIPSELLIAYGYTPIDLNNIFISDDNYEHYIKIAEEDGFPQNYCSWIKGIYGVCIEKNIKDIIAVVGGDCSNSVVLAEVLKLSGIQINPFAFPITRTLSNIKLQIDSLMNHFGVSIDDIEKVRRRLSPLRDKIIEIDKLTYKSSKVTGWENHLYQVSMSDFNLDINKYDADVNQFLETIYKREPIKHSVRVGYIGVPPITGDIYDFIENIDAKIVYNEVQREFAMPRHNQAKSIYEQYMEYTYPYDTFYRAEEIKKQIKERDVDAIIHYTQAFCYRSAQHIILKQELGVPVLHIEGDKSRNLDARTKLRIEAFIDMVKDKKLFKENIK